MSQSPQLERLRSIQQSSTPLDPPRDRLTEHALFQLRLEDMRRRGEPLDRILHAAPQSDPMGARTHSVFYDEGPGASVLRRAEEVEIINMAFANDFESRKRAFERTSARRTPKRPTSNRTVPEAAPHASPSVGWNSDLPDNISPNPRFAWSTDGGDYFVFPETKSLLSHFRARSRLRREQESMDRMLAPNHGTPVPPPGFEERRRQINYSVERVGLKQDELNAQRLLVPDKRDLFYSQDMNAFSDDIDRHSTTASSAEASNIPTDFPPHTVVNGITELATYLTSAKYIVSFGGAALPDLNYGIIIIPSGEEEMFLRDHGNPIPSTLRTEVLDKSKAMARQEDDEFQKRERRQMMEGSGVSSELDSEDKLFFKRRWLAKEREELGHYKLPPRESLPSTESSFAFRCNSKGGPGSFNNPPRFPVDPALRSPAESALHSPAESALRSPVESVPRSPIGVPWFFPWQMNARSIPDESRSHDAATTQSERVSRRSSISQPHRIRVIRTFDRRRNSSRRSSPRPKTKADSNPYRHECGPGGSTEWKHEGGAQSDTDRNPERGSQPRLPISEAYDEHRRSYASRVRKREDGSWTPRYNPSREGSYRDRSRRRSLTRNGNRRWSPWRSRSCEDYGGSRSSRYNSSGDDDRRGRNARPGITPGNQRRAGNGDASSAGHTKTKGIIPTVQRPLSSDLSKLEETPNQLVRSSTPPRPGQRNRECLQPPRTSSPSPTLDCSLRETSPLHEGPQTPPRQGSDPDTLVHDKESNVMSSETLRALELLLAHTYTPQKRRRRSFGPVINKFRRRHNSPAGDSPRDPAMSRQFLLQLGDAVSSLATGKLDKNPGIDPTTWDAAQKAINAS